MADQLSKDEHKKIFKDRILPETLDKIQGVEKPTMFMLGGQPGAGKSSVRNRIVQSQADKGGALQIDIDDLRIYHPRYLDFVKDNPETAAGRVQVDAAKWAEELYAEAVTKKVSIIYDGTLGGGKKAKKLIDQAVDAGYPVEVHVVSVSLDVSEQSVNGRYEAGFKAYREDVHDPKQTAPPRSVPGRIQKSIYSSIPGVIEELAKTGKVSRIRVADRSGKSLSDVTGKLAVKKDGGKSGRKALEDERMRPWTTKEIEAYKENGETILGNLQERIDLAGGNEKKQLQKKHTEIKDSYERVAREREAALKLVRPKFDGWVTKHTAFKFVPDLEEVD